MLIHCIICGKKATSGNLISHSHKASKKRFHANLQKLNIMLNGKKTKTYVCTNCIKSGKITKA